MVEVTLSIVNPTGLHARPAAEFVKAASQFKGTRIMVAKDGREVDAKSILSVLGLGARQGHSLTVRANGPQENEATTLLKNLLEGGFGEI